jgi:hypothetical protein
MPSASVQKHTAAEWLFGKGSAMTIAPIEIPDSITTIILTYASLADAQSALEKLEAIGIAAPSARLESTDDDSRWIISVTNSADLIPRLGQALALHWPVSVQYRTRDEGPLQELERGAVAWGTSLTEHHEPPTSHPAERQGETHMPSPTDTMKPAVTTRGSRPEHILVPGDEDPEHSS